MEEIQLHFINRSKQESPSNIVIYQRNQAALSFGEKPIAWKILQKCGIGDTQTVSFSSEVEVVIVDDAGNYGKPIVAAEGRMLEIVQGQSGPQLKLSDKMSDYPNEFGVLNSLNDQTSSVHCLRNGEILAWKQELGPGQKAQFLFSNTILIGSLEEVEVGKEMDRSDIREMADFDLTAVGSADVVFIGGEEGVSSLSLKVENIERAAFDTDEQTTSNASGVADGDMFAPPAWWNEIEEKKELAAFEGESFSPTDYWDEIKKRKKTEPSSDGEVDDSSVTKVVTPPSSMNRGKAGGSFDSRSGSGDLESFDELPDMFAPPSWWNEIEEKKKTETSGDSNKVESEEVFDPPPWWNEIEGQKETTSFPDEDFTDSSDLESFDKLPDMFAPPPWWNENETTEIVENSEESNETEPDEVFNPPPWWKEIETQKNKDAEVRTDYSEPGDMFVPPPWWNEIEDRKRAEAASEEESDSDASSEEDESKDEE